MRNIKLFSKIIISGLFLLGTGLELRGEGDPAPTEDLANSKDASGLLDGDAASTAEKKEEPAVEPAKEEPAKEEPAKETETVKEEEPAKKDDAELTKDDKAEAPAPEALPEEAAPAAAEAAAPMPAEPAPPPAVPEEAPAPAPAPVAAAPAADGRVVRFVKIDNAPSFSQAGESANPVFNYAKGDPLLVKEQGEWAEINEHNFIKTSVLSTKIVPRKGTNPWLKGSPSKGQEDETDDDESDDESDT